MRGIWSFATPTKEQATGPASDRIVDGSPRSFVRVAFADDDGRIEAGRWSSTPGRWRVAYDETEYCRIIEGSGAIIDAEGLRMPIAVGDEFVVAAGFEGEWEVTEAMTKTYVTVLP